MTTQETLRLLDELEKLGFGNAAFALLHFHRNDPKKKSATIEGHRKYCRKHSSFPAESNNARVQRRLALVLDRYLALRANSRSLAQFARLADEAFDRIPPVYPYAVTGKAGRGDGGEKDAWEPHGGSKAGDFPSTGTTDPPATDPGHAVSVPEGRELLRLHRSRERNRGLVARKKRRVQAETGRLECEACGVRFRGRIRRDWVRVRRVPSHPALGADGRARHHP
jgi:hypothetical protein